MSAAHRLAAALSLAVAVTAGCASIDQPLQSDLGSSSADVQSCARWFAGLDDAIADAGVRDGEAYPVPGFPYLRVNRFLASFRDQAAGDPAAFSAWESQLRALDARTRGYELQNLPPAALAGLGDAGVADATAHGDRCAAVLMKEDDGNASRRDRLVQAARVPDDYSDWKRAVGLYPVVRIPFFQFAKGWESDATKQFDATDAASVPPDSLVRYQPSGPAASAAEVAALFKRATRDALGIPSFSADDTEVLFRTFAPVYEVETGGEFDRPGPLRWGKREAPEVDAAHPAVYRRLAFTRYRGQTLVQVVYLIWFSERPDSGWLDPLSGELDGLFFRVTLDTAGRPLVYDTIHPCGCYHMFFPTALMAPLPAPDPDIEWAFVPRRLPAIELPQRMVLRVQSQTHYLVGIHPEAAPGPAGTAYALADEFDLRTLPSATGPRSIYGRGGIVRGTERGERFATWPLGLDEAGSMREWGRHATALIGRRQFDDADLIERRFALQPVSAEAAGTGDGR
jgi:hypothetical protein